MIFSGAEGEKFYKSFAPVTKRTREMFLPYSGVGSFGDTSFSLIYAWNSSFGYGVRELNDCLLVTEDGIDGRTICMIIKNEKTDITAAVAEALNIFEYEGIPLRIGYVGEDELEMYCDTAKRLGRRAEYETFREDADYIYNTEEFIAIEGRVNKKKRADLNSLMRNYPDITMRLYDGNDKAFAAECVGVFDRWCSVRSCKDCIYGCEKRALMRFLDIFDPERHRLGAAFSEGKMLSFALSERINNDMVCYYFQKNAERIRGLTYWLNREMAMGHTDVSYINLGEDMGLPGIRTDKESLRPCGLLNKYTVTIE